MATISSLGIGSGLDSESIVTKLVALEKQPLKALEARATFEKSRISAFGQIQSQFSSLADVSTRISTASAWTARTASSSNTSAATISATSTTAATAFTLDVDALATSQSSSSAAITTGSVVGSGTLTFRIGKWNGVSGSALSDNAGVQAADLALPAAQAALVAAQNTLAAKSALLVAADNDLAAALPLSTAANAALISANADLNAATSADSIASATLAAADASLLSATNAFNSATTDFNTKDNALTAANGAAVAANANSVTKTSDAAIALGAFQASRDADIDAATLIADFVSTDVDGPKAASFSNAYTAWVSAISANDHATPTLQAAEDSAFAAVKIAYGALGASFPSVQTAVHGLITGAGAGSDPALVSSATSGLKASSVAASSLASSASVAASAANAAALIAQDVRDAAALALSTATTNRDNADAAQIVAAADASAAAAAKAVALATQLQAVSDAAAANAVTADSTEAQLTASNEVGIATQAVANATTAVDNATTGTSAARPTFTAAAGSSDVAITVIGTDTVASIAAKINAANFGVIASVFKDGVNERLQLVSKNTGADAGFRVQVSDTGDSVDTDDSGLSRLAYDPQTSAFGMAGSGIPAQYGQDAKARINGLAVTSKTNTLSENIPGVTINLVATTTQGYGTPGETRASINMAVREDVTGAVRNVQDFVTAYNALATNLADLTKYDAATKTGSLFQADSSVVGLQNLLRNMIGSVSNGSVYKRLNEVGIERQLDGSLSINIVKLSAAANNGAELQNLFITDNKNVQTNGFAIKFANFAKGAVTLGGVVANKAVALDKGLVQNSAEQTRINERAAATEARLRRQYSALDAKMANLSALNAYVSQQVTTWNKSTG